jgi:hypothetical protein
VLPSPNYDRDRSRNRAEKVEDPEERFIKVLQYYLAGWHIKPKGVKKPYNPVLGEFFRCRYEYPDGSRGFYIAEQSKSSIASPRLLDFSLCVAVKKEQRLTRGYSITPPADLCLLLHLTRKPAHHHR